MRDDVPLALLTVFVPFSLVSIGGGPSILAGIQHEAVDVHHWVTSREFVELFAISRAAPGPGSMLTTLIGWHVAGLTGAFVATWPCSSHPRFCVTASLPPGTGIAASAGTARSNGGSRRSASDSSSPAPCPSCG